MVVDGRDRDAETQACRRSLAEDRCGCNVLKRGAGPELVSPGPIITFLLQYHRAVVFCSEDDHEDSRFSGRGRHVQYGRIRTYVEIPELRCTSILSTNSQITIGSNVPEASNAKENLLGLLEAQGKALSVVSIRVSDKSYRPR